MLYYYPNKNIFIYILWINDKYNKLLHDYPFKITPNYEKYKRSYYHRIQIIKYLASASMIIIADVCGLTLLWFMSIIHMNTQVGGGGGMGYWDVGKEGQK